MWITPITDRTMTDVREARNVSSTTTTHLKGALNFSDLNRIEGNMRYLSDMFLSYGYSATIDTKTDWIEDDIPTLEEINRIRNNAIFLCEKYVAMPNAPTIRMSNYLDFVDVNNLELILYQLNVLLENMIAVFRKSGTFVAGQSNGLRGFDL